jgi:hypothetical protein
VSTDRDLDAIRDLATTLTTWVTAGIFRDVADQLAGHPKAQAFHHDPTVTARDPTRGAQSHAESLVTVEHGDALSADIARRNGHDRAATDGRRANQAIHAAYTSLTLAHNILSHYRPATTTTPADPTDWCRLHLEHLGHTVTRYRGQLCRLCYDYWLTNRTEPSRPELVYRDSHGRWPLGAIDPKLKMRTR